MKTLYRTTTVGIALLLMVSFAGCVDLAVDNNNSPSREQVLGTPQDVVGLVGGSFLDFWRANMWGDGQVPLSSIADEWSVSWANYSSRALSSEPRVAFNNSSAFRYARASNNPWNRNYLAISNASDALAIITADEDAFTTEGINVPRLKAFSKFIQGIAHGYIALRFDQGFTVDENVDLANTVLELQPYNQVMDFAIQKLEESIAISNAGHDPITATDDWIFGLDVTAADLAKLSHSFIARFQAMVARDPAERAAVNWSSVMQHVNAGITEDWAPIGNDSGDLEWDPTKSWAQEGRTWSRADYRTIGPADESGGYQNWLNTPVQERNVFDIVSHDRRIVGPEDGSETIVADEQRQRGGVYEAGDVLTYPQNSGTDFEYWGVPGPFPSSRGTYHYSSHTHKRYRAWLDAGDNGPMVQMKVTEMDMLMAEGLLHTGGSTATVADLLNKTRVNRAELEPATAATPVGSPDHGSNDLSYTPTQAGATLWDMLKYEKNIDCYVAASGRAYFDDRGWGDLVVGTPIHFAVPGSELEVLQLQLYTFGGVGNPGGAPKSGREGPRADKWGARVK